YDWESFGVALKMTGDSFPGEESVVNAFFALWLSVYQDERAEEFEPFQRGDVIHDRRHRSALMWVERFAVPATASDQVHFLLWLLARMHEIIPIAWARFDGVDDAVKSQATAEPAFVLIRQRRLGEAVALAGTAHSRDVRLLVVGETAEHAPDALGPALDLLDDETLADTPPDELADLVGSVARHAPAHLAALLARL